MTDFVDFTDLASRKFGGSVVVANDEFFVEKENLIKPETPVSCKGMPSSRGGVYDGWETRRRRKPGHDWVVIKLGMPGVIRGITADTAYFRGNYPDRLSVDACAFDGFPSAEELVGPGADWVELVPEANCEGDTENRFAVHDERRFTHVRLNIHPDGGVARLRVHGEVVADPRHFDGVSLDLAALENGGGVVDASDNFFNPADNVISPGDARGTKEGWETKRRRDDGHDWMVVRLAAPGVVRQAVIDTTRFIGNAPDECSLQAWDATGSQLDDPAAWWDLLPTTRVQPDTVHRLSLTPGGRPATHVRLNIYPDGGLARLRLWGHLSEMGRTALGVAWFNRLPTRHAVGVLVGLGLDGGQADELATRRPLGAALDVRSVLDGLSGRVDPAAASAVSDLLTGPGA